MDTQDGQSAIEIQPADPQVVYVPIYSPTYVWGPPVWGAYSDLWYPSGFGWGFGYGPGIYMSGYFPSWGGWGGWGWGCGWFGRSLFLNTGFFSRYGFRGGRFRALRRAMGAVDSEGGLHGRIILATEWAFPIRTGRWRAGSTRPIQFGPIRRRQNEWGQFAGGARSNAGQWNGGRMDSGRPGATQLNRTPTSAGVSGVRSASPGEWRRFGDGNRSPSTGRSDARGFARSGDSGFRSGNRGDAGSYRQSIAELWRQWRFTGLPGSSAKLWRVRLGAGRPEFVVIWPVCLAGLLGSAW